MKATRWAEGSRTAMFSKMLRYCQYICVYKLNALEARKCGSLVTFHANSGHSREGGGVHDIGGNLDQRSNEPEQETDLPSLQTASNTSVQNSKSLSLVDVVAVRRRAAPAIGESAVHSAGNSACSGSRGQEDGLEAHDVVLAIEKRARWQ